jgi:putative transposase
MLKLDDEPQKNCGWKKNLEPCFRREERRNLIDWQEKERPIITQARLLHMSRKSLYYQPRPPSAEEVALKHRIDEIFTQCPFTDIAKSPSNCIVKGERSTGKQ